MSRQNIGQGITLITGITAANGEPSGDDASRLVVATAFKYANPKPIDWLLRVRGTTPLTSPPTAIEFYAYLWGRDQQDQVWGQLGNADGILNGGDLITGNTTAVRYFMLQNLGLFQDLYIQFSDLSGTGLSLNATLFPVYNCEADGPLVGVS